MTRRERLLIVAGIITIPAALFYGEYQLRRGAELAAHNCNATLDVATEELSTCRKCKTYLSRFRSLQRWYTRDSGFGSRSR